MPSCWCKEGSDPSPHLNAVAHSRNAAIISVCVVPLRSSAGEHMPRLAPLQDVLQHRAAAAADARLPEVLSAIADACRDVAHTVSQFAIRDLGGAQLTVA